MDASKLETQVLWDAVDMRVSGSPSASDARSELRRRMDRMQMALEAIANNAAREDNYYLMNRARNALADA